MESLSSDDTRNLICAALAPDRVERLESDRELYFTYAVRENRPCLGCVYFEREGVTAVFRIAPSAAPLPAKLGLPSLVADAVRSTQGLVVIASPPGHGKSTALASLVELINSEREAAVLTIEERVMHPHVNRKSVIHQREVGRDTLSVVSALATAARQDPDVLVVDPMNDAETIRRVLAFAGRGHLAIGSMEADTVIEALEKLLDAAEDGDPKRNPSCSGGPLTDPVSFRRQLGALLLVIAALRLLPRKDASGRVCACELLRVDAGIARLIRTGDLKTLAKRMTAPDETGLWSMDSFILKLHERGLVDDEAARRVLLDRDVPES
jgi:twitching motility protein PilT